ncbi:hypothetical protein [Arthrospira platensis]|uniref:hypothetical protein n=1 Tax=Limnospira TaxID=2596745 RepID=UPI0001D0E503|nr:hypothetical protein [Arthrospira platensis]MBD2667647.1 hypothetical protein [Arthrospira platensis FACHB-439]MBD2708877.1 hypothetical protein [Arthrospira platensis FACHB-835]MDT9181268.1 hypothetical protein [Limnospira sp. PMC 289.06]MDT9293538.1 hypothetical protein [Arthrospira platensis PCC 7345]QQW29510.1 hypothetical protein AP9108_00805 [Arthrospira sp. PCC 9108]BAI88043.1 hypothetical protein NIES39_A02040 [Arthrospira platensis NIES-39]
MGVSLVCSVYEGCPLVPNRGGYGQDVVKKSFKILGDRDTFRDRFTVKLDEAKLLSLPTLKFRVIS